MDAVPYLLLGVPILALIIGGPLLKSRLGRNASEAGDETGRRFAAEKLTQTLGEFGTTLVIHAPERIAREIVASAMANKQREYVIRSDGDYGIRFIEPDDSIVHLHTDHEGIRMQVETFREYMGFPQTAPLWTELRSRVTSAAGAREIPVTAGEPIGFIRGALIDDRNARWVRDS
ncbi:MAG: hypothetical protein ACRDT7_12750 [Microbacterium sp.]